MSVDVYEHLSTLDLLTDEFVGLIAEGMDLYQAVQQYSEKLKKFFINLARELNSSQKQGTF